MKCLAALPSPADRRVGFGRVRRGIRVYLDSGAKKTFAMAIDWPGWGRSGRTREEALAALVDYGPRYATVAKRAGIPFDPPAAVSDLAVEETVRGNATTDFGGARSAASIRRGPVE